MYCSKQLFTKFNVRFEDARLHMTTQENQHIIFLKLKPKVDLTFHL